MSRLTVATLGLLLAMMLVSVAMISTPALAQDLTVIELPSPSMVGGMPLMQALRDRHTSRSFSPRPLPLQTLSNLLWAAFGVNRPEAGKRTAPSAVNWQEIDIYVVLPEGVYLYDAHGNQLEPVRAGDQRALTGTQEFVRDAPVTLVFVADESKITGGAMGDVTFYSAIDTGFISQNVYLFCASEGLATGVRALIDRPPLAEALRLRSDQRIVVAQTVGYPAG